MTIQTDIHSGDLGNRMRLKKCEEPSPRPSPGVPGEGEKADARFRCRGEAAQRCGAGAPCWPGWVEGEFEESGRHHFFDTHKMWAWTCMETERFRFMRLAIEGADELKGADFQETARSAYEAMTREMSSGAHRHPIRFWNYIPGIHRVGVEGIDRYMTFNAGRFSACQAWFGGNAGERFEQRLPTATGVGHLGSELVIDCLSGALAGTAVENDRQIPAYRYSERYGPRPPCFARATLMAGGLSSGDRLIIGGTASVVGEDSLHLNDLDGQIVETLRNIAAVIFRASGTKQNNFDESGAALSEAEFSALQFLGEVRVLYPRAGHRGWIEKALQGVVSERCAVEFVQAGLCRSELLVEIEGIAQVPAKMGG